MGAPDEELDSLWMTLRDELRKVDTTRGIRGGPAQTRQIVFADACAMYDAKNAGYIHFADLRKALTAARIERHLIDKDL